MKRLAAVVFIGIAIIMGLWLWAILFYAFDLRSPDLARPTTIPILLIDYGLSPTFSTRLLASGGVVAFLYAIAGVMWLYLRPRKQLGDARFATEAEVRKMGLRASDGIVLGKLGGKYLIDNGQTHVLVSAPTGSGKGVGIVIPNLLTWNGSAVVLDIKGENFALTSGFRKKHGQNIFVFSPFSDRSHCFNPFDLVDEDPKQRINSLQNIANVLLPDTEKDAIWSQQGRALFVAFALYLIDKNGEDCTMGNILRYLQTADDTKQVAEAILANMGEELDPAARRTFANFSQQEQRMRESVKIGLTGALTLWNSPTVDAATSKTEIKANILRRKKTTVYVTVSLADITALKPILRLFFEQVFSAQLREEPGSDDKHKVLFLLDEFESLGTAQSIVDRLPFVRSFGVRIVAIIQGLSQLDERYQQSGREKILQGSKHQVFFASNDQQTTNYVSQTLGKTTIRTSSRSHSRHGFSTTRQYQARDLMLPQEVRELPSDELLVVTEGARPIKAKKIFYFKDRILKKRAGHDPVSIPLLDLKPRSELTLGKIRGEETTQDDSEHSVQEASVQISPISGVSSQKHKPSFGGLFDTLQNNENEALDKSQNAHDSQNSDQNGNQGDITDISTIIGPDGPMPST